MGRGNKTAQRDTAGANTTDMTDKTQTFNYGENPVTFNGGEHIMVNATEMAKPFGKFTKDWLSNKISKEFLSTLSSVRGIPLSQLVISKKGNSSGYTQGTWMHEDVAIEFARWLSPQFAIWCNDRIKEIIAGGAAVKLVKEEERISHLLELSNDQQKEIVGLRERLKNIEYWENMHRTVIRHTAAKVWYFNRMMNLDNVFTATQIAAELGMTARSLNMKLSAAGLIRYDSGLSRWTLRDEWLDMKLVDTRAVMRGNRRIEYLVWTQKGRMLIHVISAVRWDIDKAMDNSPHESGVERYMDFKDLKQE